MSVQSLRISALIAVLVGLMLVGCGEKKPEGEGAAGAGGGEKTPEGEGAAGAGGAGAGGGEGAVPDKAAAGPVKIGAVLPTTGATATYGEETLNGLKMAIDEINAKGEPKLELVVKDDKGDSTETAKLVGQLITVDKVKAIIGSVASTNTLKGAKVAQENAIPLITPGSTNAEITKKGEYISRICFIDPVQGSVLAKLALEDLGKKRAAIVVDKASDYSVGLATAFREAFVQGGGEVLGEESFTQGEADYSALVTKIAALSPDVIFVPAYYGDVGPMLKQAGDKWSSVPIVSGDGIDSPDFFSLMGSYGGEIYMSTHFAPDDSDPKVREFVNKYKELYGKTPGAMSALGYDSAYALHDALVRAGTSEAGKLKDAINTIKDLPGITGKITINAERNADKDVVVLKLSPTGATFYKRITSK